MRGVQCDREEALRADDRAHLLHIEATCPHISGDEYPCGAIPECSQRVQHHTIIITRTTTPSNKLHSKAQHSSLEWDCKRQGGVKFYTVMFSAHFNSSDERGRELLRT